MLLLLLLLLLLLYPLLAKQDLSLLNDPSCTLEAAEAAAAVLSLGGASVTP